MPHEDELPLIEKCREEWLPELRPEGVNQTWLADRVIAASARILWAELQEDAWRFRKAERARLNCSGDRDVEVAQLANGLAKNPGVVALKLRQTLHGANWLSRQLGVLAGLLDRGAPRENQASEGGGLQDGLDETDQTAAMLDRGPGVDSTIRLYDRYRKDAERVRTQALADLRQAQSEAEAARKAKEKKEATTMDPWYESVRRPAGARTRVVPRRQPTSQAEVVANAPIAEEPLRQPTPVVEPAAAAEPEVVIVPATREGRGSAGRPRRASGPCGRGRDRDR